jgi:predicted TIM-barrel fold metal-dependent hydrolase
LIGRGAVPALAALACLAPGCRSRPAPSPPATAGAATTDPVPAAVPTAAATTAAPTPVPAHRFHRIDVHTHISPDGVERAVRLMNEWGIDGMVNLSGMHPGPPHNVLEKQLASAAESGGRIAVFTTPDFRLVQRRPDYGAAMAEQLTQARRLGAIGLKITKGLGLGYRAHDGVHLLAVDDPGLDPLFERAGELGMPVAIHCGDPKAFWKPATPDNERWDELQAHPEWSFAGSGVPSWQQLYDAFERRVARHPKTTFIAVHFGNDPEDADNVARMLDRYPNFFIDTAARVPEIGRHPAEKMRRFFK